MHIPSSFFYSETQSKISYDSIPAGAPNIDRFLVGLPAFPTPTLAREERPKKLVLADWTMPAWSQEKIMSLGPILDELQEKGFSLYRWHDGKVIPLDKQGTTDLINELLADAINKQIDMHEMHEMRYMRYMRDMEDEKLEFNEEAYVQKPLSITPAEDIRLAVSHSKQGIPFEQIQILDDYWLNHLMSDAETPGPRVLRISEVPELDMKTPKLAELAAENLDALVKLIKSATPKLEKIILDKNLDHQDEFTYKLLDNLLCDDVIVIEIPEGIKKLTLRNAQLSSANLSRILQSAVQVESIDLFNYNSRLDKPDEPLTLEAGSLANLKHLELNQANISLEGLINILEAAPNLEFLDISICSSLQGASLIDINLLQRLENLSIGDRDSVSRENIERLASAPKLTQASKDNIDRWYEYQERFPASNTYNTNSSSQGALAPINPTHNPAQMRDFKSPSDKFKFTGMNKTKNQGMIIEKFCQYLTIQSQHLALIPKIQEGICFALSNYFKDTDEVLWNDFINKSLAWNGKKTKLDEALTGHFEKLYTYVDKHYLKPALSNAIYVGDNLDWLEDIKDAVILANPWHAIAIKPLADGRFQVYDPNYVTGYLEVEHHELLSVIHESIGSLISVRTNEQAPEFRIKDSNAFIEEGGLLVLNSCVNAPEIMAQLPAPGERFYTKAALDGLLLRNIEAKPAWLCCLESHNEPLRQFTLGLLEQFQKNNADYGQQLLKSIDALTPAQKGEAITKIVQFFPGGAAANEGLISEIRASANQQLYEQSLETWKKTAKLITSPLEYIQHCLNGPQKLLVELDSTQDLDALRVQLEKQATQPVFYVDNPEDLICASPYVARQKDNSGLLRKGPGGPLFDFLQANHANNPLIIVNYERFNSDDIVKFNSLLDKEAKADGSLLPPNTKIIGLVNRNKPDCYQGSDFYSRFNTTEICPLTSKELENLSPKCEIALATATSKQDITAINLFHAQDWKERLLGRWVLDGDKLTFEDGALIKAIDAGQPIEIQNGLWQDKDFQRFWQQALSCGVQHNGARIKIPEHLAVTRPEVDAYVWEDLQSQVISVNHSLSNDANSMTLNPGNLTNFLERHELDGKRLIRKPGFLAQCVLDGKKVCSINITRDLSEDELAMLLTEAKKLYVKLDIHYSPGVTLPDIFTFHSEQSANTKIDIPPYSSANHAIYSSDPDATVEVVLAKEDKDIVIIDVSECKASDILYRLDGGLNDDEEPCFEFSQRDCAVNNALAEGKTVCLKGNFSKDLLDSLAPLLLERERISSSGKLILVTTEKTAALFVANKSSHNVQAEEKLACLNFDGQVIEAIKPFSATEPLSNLQARAAFLQSHPKDNSDDAWLGMEHLPNIPNLAAEGLNRATSADDSEQHTKKRLKQVNDVLKHEPYVFLTGLSGVGKSTFVKKELRRRDALHIGEAQILAWINDTSPKRKILFLDEANLSPKLWSEFEGLYNKPASILVNGVLYPLSEQHKVVFAGNPVNYGDERTMAPFFQRHGNAVLFDPLPLAVIYEDILKPIFAGMENSLDKASDQILAMYAFVCSCSTTEILISPRELEMIALLTRSRIKQNPKLDANEVAAHFVYELAKNLVPAARRAEFDEMFKPENTLVFLKDSAESEKAGAFLITPSRQAISQQLDDLLSLRENRIVDHANSKPEALMSEQELMAYNKQQFGGLGGIIIEGEPGIGKSELVVAELISRNYEEEHDFKNPSLKTHPFYRMPVSMSLSEKEDLLIKALNEGAVVIIDEINSSPMMEKLLNDLLMGENPKNGALKAEKPGFMVIGTQNPITMAGRRAPSTALQRRLITTTLPEYAAIEIHSILCKKGIPESEAALMTAAYESNRKKAIDGKLQPVPNFRNLMNLADDYLKAQQYEKAAETSELDASATYKKPKSTSSLSMFNQQNHHPTTDSENKPFNQPKSHGAM
jgi:AAA domain (dynein-related subfamily)